MVYINLHIYIESPASPSYSPTINYSGGGSYSGHSASPHIVPAANMQYGPNSPIYNPNSPAYYAASPRKH